MRRSPELMQLLIGISTRRYFPASGTAGLLRSCVNGYSRAPRPPPKITAMTFSTASNDTPAARNGPYDFWARSVISRSLHQRRTEHDDERLDPLCTGLQVAPGDAAD